MTHPSQVMAMIASVARCALFLLISERAPAAIVITCNELADFRQQPQHTAGCAGTSPTLSARFNPAFGIVVQQGSDPQKFSLYHYIQWQRNGANIPVATQTILPDPPDGDVTVSLQLPSYEWYRNGSPLVDGVRISGATTQSLMIDAVQADDAGQHYGPAKFYRLRIN